MYLKNCYRNKMVSKTLNDCYIDTHQLNKRSYRQSFPERLFTKYELHHFYYRSALWIVKYIHKTLCLFKHTRLYALEEEEKC